MSSRAQGALEYILLLGGVIAIVVLVYSMLTGFGGATNQLINERLGAYNEAITGG